MYQLSLKPYYNSVNQCYTQLIVIYPKPSGALLNIIKQVPPTNLSPFLKYSTCEPQPSCFYAILNPTRKCDFLYIDDLPLLLCFLTENDYKIDYNITKILMKSNTSIQDTLLFYIN